MSLIANQKVRWVEREWGPQLGTVEANKGVRTRIGAARKVLDGNDRQTDISSIIAGVHNPRRDAARDRGLCGPQRTEGSYHYLWPATSS